MRLRILALAVTVGFLAASCTSETEPVSLGTPVEPTEATTSTGPPPSSTTTSIAVATSSVPAAPAAAPKPPPPPPPGLGPGSRGPAVLALERKLDTLRYDVGAVDDSYDRVTAHAVMAFQKVHGFGRTGRATDDVLAAVEGTQGTPPPLVPGGSPDRVEVDIPRQVLFLYRGGSLARILPVSTGSNQRFCSQGWCRRAVTPGGSFAVYRQGRGWEHGPLGSLYKPAYFNGGVAIHGATSVPAYPASHGCVRIPMNAAEWLPGQIGMGTPVFVIGGPEDVPPPAPAPPAPPADAGVAPATTVPQDAIGQLVDGLFGGG